MESFWGFTPEFSSVSTFLSLFQDNRGPKFDVAAMFNRLRNEVTGKEGFSNFMNPDQRVPPNGPNMPGNFMDGPMGPMGRPGNFDGPFR